MNVFELIKKYNITPRRQSGQNFLLENYVLEEIVDAAKLKKTENVLEVGPGLGVLTEKLLPKVKKLFSVELDKNLHYVLKQEFKKHDNFILLNENILDLHEADLKKVFNDEPYKIVANIPYNITSVFLRKFLSQFDYKPQEMVLLVQKEVAERIVASPGQLSLLAISVQLYCEAQIIDLVSKDCFYPKPAVDSAIIKLKIKKTSFDKNQIKDFFRIVKIGFAAKRKQLQNNLANGLKIDRQEVCEKLKKIGLKDSVRAQELSLDDWWQLVTSLLKS